MNEFATTQWQRALRSLSSARPRFIEGVDRPQPLIHLINGGEENYKQMTVRR